jgi:CO/xanthine dehydrogenase Mo-binding subunit
MLSVNTTEAQALAGVVAVYTSQDVPVNKYGLIIKDQPVLCGPSSTEHASIMRCYADCIAVVVAETEAIAAQAVKLIQIEYEDLPAVFDMDEALTDSAPLLHAENPILCQYMIRKGDMDTAWREADVIVEGEYHTGYKGHLRLRVSVELYDK